MSCARSRIFRIRLRRASVSHCLDPNRRRSDADEAFCWCDASLGAIVHELLAIARRVEPGRPFRGLRARPDRSGAFPGQAAATRRRTAMRSLRAFSKELDRVGIRRSEVRERAAAAGVARNHDQVVELPEHVHARLVDGGDDRLARSATNALADRPRPRRRTTRGRRSARRGRARACR